jgi:4-amino-4-deoxy-L-arabinose transferase-like glycosyltransferase
MVVLGTLLVLLVGLLGRRVGGEPVGLGAAAIAALSPNIWVNDGLVMSETVTGLAVVAALLAAFALWDRPTLLRAGLLGGASGLAALARAEFVLLVALLVAVVACTTRAPWADRSAFAVAGVATALVVVGPWVAFNVARFEEFTTISTNDGIALAGSNCDPVYRGPHTGLTSIAGPRSCLDDPPPPGDQSQVARRYRERAFDYMGDHKGRVPAVMAARVGRTWGVFRPADMVWFNLGEGRERWVTRLGMVAYYPTLVAAVAGAVLLWRRSRPALWVLAVPAVVVTAGAALTYGQTRFRAAAEPSLAILAAVALARLPNLCHSATETVGE